MTSKRDLAAANETGFSAKVVRPVYFLRLDFSTGVQRYHTEIGPRTITHPIHGAESYTGIGDFGGLEGDIVESISSAPQAVRVSVTGVKSAFNTTIITDDYFRRDVEIMIGLYDDAGVVLADPEIIFSGFMDKADLVLSDLAGRISLTCESRATNLKLSSDWRFTDEDLQIEFTGDLLAEYVWRMLDLQLFWGSKEVVTSLGGGGGASPYGDGPLPERE
ncbi:MAG: hypothetical protein V3S69_07435 [Dehalococcoidales bacterium]